MLCKIDTWRRVAELCDMKVAWWVRGLGFVETGEETT